MGFDKPGATHGPETQDCSRSCLTPCPRDDSSPAKRVAAADHKRTTPVIPSESRAFLFLGSSSGTKCLRSGASGIARLGVSCGLVGCRRGFVVGPLPRVRSTLVRSKRGQPPWGNRDPEQTDSQCGRWRRSGLSPSGGGWGKPFNDLVGHLLRLDVLRRGVIEFAGRNRFIQHHIPEVEH